MNNDMLCIISHNLLCNDVYLTCHFGVTHGLTYQTTLILCVAVCEKTNVVSYLGLYGTRAILLTNLSYIACMRNDLPI
jgi:hypothetical protein